jgi:dienelactone hydrolase
MSFLRSRAALACAALVILACSTPAPGAARERTPAENAMREAPNGQALRARLLEIAQRGVGAAAPGADTASVSRFDAGEAAFRAGESFSRAGVSDSAIMCFQAATGLRRGREEMLALVDQLLARRSPDDLMLSRALLETTLRGLGGQSPASLAPLQGRLAWARLLAGEPDTAVALFAPVEATLSASLDWRYRMGRAHVEGGDPRHAYTHLLPVVVASRRGDREAVELIERAADQMDVRKHLETELVQAQAARDRMEEPLVQALGGRRVRFPAADASGLGGVLVPAAKSSLRRAAIVYVAPGDTLASYDSLAVQLHRAGLVVLLLDTRGSGWSVSLDCPLPDAWRGREDAMRDRCARDLGAALRFLHLEAGVDTSACLVAGVGPTGGIAIQAARFDPRVRAMLLVSPAPSPVEVPDLCAALRTRPVPAYFQIAPEDYAVTWEVTDLLYQAGARGASRVADSKRRGRFAEQFRHDAAIAPRFTAWLDATWPPPTSRRR